MSELASESTTQSELASESTTQSWREAAEELAATLRKDAAARDAAGANPDREVELLRESGLLRLLIPADRGGTGAGWLAANTVTRIVSAAAADPHIVAGYGELVAAVRAAGALTDVAAAALGAAFDRGPGLSEVERADAAVAISAAKVVATRVVNETTSKVFEFTGARATATKYGFDRFWRNARTLTLHDPVVYKAREVGAHFLNGERPAYTGYS